MLWLAVDCETTGLLPSKDRITELGWAVYEPFSKKIVRVGNYLMWDDSYPTLTPLIVELTGLTDDLLRRFGHRPCDVMEAFYADLKQCSHLVAHNAPFDASFINSESLKAGNFPVEYKIIDTSKDVPYPKNITTRKLTHLAAEHGFVNPLAHRAVTDVFTMLKIIEPYDPIEIANWSSSPTIKVKAMVTRETKELAKERGYRWDSPQVAWFKEIKEFHLEKEIKDSPFQVVVVETRNA